MKFDNLKFKFIIYLNHLTLKKNSNFNSTILNKLFHIIYLVYHFT